MPTYWKTMTLSVGMKTLLEDQPSRLMYVCVDLEVFANHQNNASKDRFMPERELNNLLVDYVSTAEKKGFAGNYINSTMKARDPFMIHLQKSFTVSYISV